MRDVHELRRHPRDPETVNFGYVLMGKKRARDTEDQATAAPRPSAPDAKKRKSSDDAPGAGVCDDVLDNIFTRLPTGTAVASMVLSKHHHHLICSSEFRRLHFRLSQPLVNPHIAYIVISKFHGFHVAGAGHNSDAPMHTLGGIYYEMKYINTCNGILLFAREREMKPPTCILWNPALANDKKELSIPAYTRKRDDYRRLQPTCRNDAGDYSILGLGYGKRSKSYKLLISYRQMQRETLLSKPPQSTYCKELQVYTLGTDRQTPRLVKFLSQGMDLEISQESLFIDGVIYLLFYKKQILAFDIDNEKLTTIEQPGSSWYPCENRITSELMSFSGRPCLVKNYGGKRALWILTVDLQWERRCVFKVEDDLIFCPIKGVWDYNGVLFLFLYNKTGESKLILHKVTTKKMLMKNLSYDLTPKGSHYSFCWDYKPTLLSPRSIIEELNQDVNLLGTSKHIDIVKAKRPFNKLEKRKVPKAALATIRFMDYLIHIMEKLPGNMQEIKMPLLNSEELVN
ncbi:hypothetical protein PR202_ga19195 [Eleusine coracana subsp. coracana]|uniref:F-box associated beta-propeller type 3 domain-containing protein n=1 Tax=Eleusine coracana subsp. coracana TaxID=191504 RepID=A0AAV5CV02_ELECO|nr:hypothetical protein QOZ80_4AG0305740 [Eleusine coracana subsp. coracana]GJN01893.1 hypothetical protein PR202_ga19195 [Eleusine coracana subsp. coracana]